MAKGVEVRNPLTLDIGEEVNIDRIANHGVKIYPNCRIYGEKTVIAPGAQIGYEGPVTIENCQLGPKVELKGGYFKESVFLEKASMGLNAQVREGCILEEQASGGHCVGLKQTILFPFVTLGSLINFCDCLMAGGTSRKYHSEVGSSYIHFNFTPNGDKATPSLIGDVPRGVMLTQRPIFLGGQGGIVGPVRLGYGNVVAAGTILRNDAPEDHKLIYGKPYRSTITDFRPNRYPDLSRIIENNILYLANLTALAQWYSHVRRLFFNTQTFGDLIYDGVLDKLALAQKERIKRLKIMAGNVSMSLEKNKHKESVAMGKHELSDQIDKIGALFTSEATAKAGTRDRDRFLAALHNHQKETGGSYIDILQSLPNSLSQEGTQWLQQIIDALCGQAAAILPSLNLFKKHSLKHRSARR
jgi:UDP-N-acetylglucosamine/UDP-N-acetylgalactosamine diphosphorylase